MLQTAVLHVQSAGKDEVRSGDVLAAILQQPKAYAAQLLEAQGITRLDVLNYISHGIAKNAESEGLIVRALMDRVAFCPPLIITEAEIDEMFDCFTRALEATWAHVTSEGLASVA